MNFLLRFGAVCGALSGLLIAIPGAVEAVTGETAVTSLVIGVSPALAAPLLTALHLTQPRTRLGDVAYAVNTVGLGLFGAAAYALNIVVFHLGAPVLAAPTRVVLLVSALVFAVGCVLFGVAMLRAKAHPPVPAWAYAVALPVFTLAARLPDTVLTSGLHVVVGGSLVWLALSLRTRYGAQAATTAHVTSAS
ncbi:hypothetical protein [Saccharothrix syringae]|uniref:DUF998 domain-containing protein n=1 Tax=Saccharothrix syringae TaxID=103733 RepID=A0A5Q0GVS1_SACSY|nr:hypothetical protein [Saccharothrix syringae]QFZ18167.1 hypothetical protein EKG83_12340 [Saccharothrix syringae]